MALTFAFKQSLKRKSRKARRWEVASFGLVMAFGLVGAELTSRPGRGWVWWLLPWVVAVERIYSPKLWQRSIAVSSLDDRAMLEYGVLFEQLSDPEQKALLKRYRVGTYLMGYYPDEREQTVRSESMVSANRLLRWLLPLLAGLYVIGWKLLPAGVPRECLTDSPTVLGWIFVLVLALPELIRLWTEEDISPEPRVVAEADV